ncbi:ATPase [Methanocella sp. CWC-04]|uniref:ATPase n=1 Tax=Methanooceanicella nereidis TaxID=2052831 RepID=A0AAP2RDP2_9EURY|nr:AAA family ATPase [Methanocella sp. CWC-04]MCD1295711.1 ATPase [Methanocella sp. CWC-04]
MSEFEDHFKERSDEINCALLAIISGENLLYLGPPGTAKSLLSKNICEVVDGYFFYYLLTRFTTPEEIFGPLSLKALQHDDFRRKVDGYLPTAHIAFLDEIFKSNSSILNSLLTILNEKRFHNGRDVIKIPLLSVFGASNELPDEDENLEALYDRFLFRCSVSCVRDENNFKELIFGDADSFKPSFKIPLEKIDEIKRVSGKVKIDRDVEKIILETRKEFLRKNIHLSDRRWKKIVNVLKIASASMGNEVVDRSMVLLLQHMTWDTPSQKEHIRNILIDQIISGGESLEKLKKDVTDLYFLVQRTMDYKFPLPIRCYQCNEIFDTSKKLGVHRKIFSNHMYYDPHRISLNLRYFNYPDLVKVLKEEYKWNFIDNTPERSRSYATELVDLKERFEHARKKVEEEFELLKKLFAENIWITENDRIEVLNRYEHKINPLQEIKETFRMIESMLEQNEQISIVEKMSSLEATAQ